MYPGLHTFVSPSRSQASDTTATRICFVCTAARITSSFLPKKRTKENFGNDDCPFSAASARSPTNRSGRALGGWAPPESPTPRAETTAPPLRSLLARPTRRRRRGRGRLVGVSATAGRVREERRLLLVRAAGSPLFLACAANDAVSSRRSADRRPPTPARRPRWAGAWRAE